MINPKKQSLTILSILLTATAAATARDCSSRQECIGDANQETDSNEFICGLYLAKSTIPNAGLGVFTGISHQVGSSVAAPEIAHQLLVEFYGDNERTSPIPTNVMKEYTRESFITGGSFENKHVLSLVPNMGMVVNGFLPLANVFMKVSDFDSAGVNSINQMGPGSGAFSPYHNTVCVAEVPLEAGVELFEDYGELYFRDRDKYATVPFTSDFFEVADEMLAKFWGAVEASANKQWLTQEVWDAIREFVTDERVRNALPESVVDIPRAAKDGTVHNFLGGNNPRSLDWLQSNGYCMDTLTIQPSSIPHAGRGAFSKKAFKAGETILPLPMLQIEREELDILGEQGVQSQQLILNYCFGHKHSSLLLYPYSSTSNFVNHNGKGANAKVVWAQNDPTGFHKAEWFNLTTKDLIEKEHTGLLMLLVATRDIDKDEEVTIDYGSDWLEAWEKHVQNWSPDSMQMSAAEMNESKKQLETIFEDRNPNPVMTVCHYKSSFEHETFEHSPGPAPNMFVDRSDNDIQSLKEKLPWIESHAVIWNDHNDAYLNSCEILAISLRKRTS